MNKIVQFSDCHIFSDKEKCAYLGIKSYYTFEQCLKIAAQEDALAYVFTGDISGDDSIESYQHFWRVACQLLPVEKIKILPGNHDDKKAMEKVLPKDTLVANSVVKIADSDVVFLDAQYEGAKARVNINDVNTLLALCRNDEKNILFMHHHPVQSNSWMDKHELVNRDEFMSVLSTYEREIHVFHGHIHHAGQSKVHNISIVSCPSTCWQWLMQKDFALASEAPGYRVINVDRLTSEVVRINYRL